MVFDHSHDEPPSYDEPQAEPVDDNRTATRCRGCGCRSETVCPYDGLGMCCWSPNPYGNEAYDDYDDREVEPPLDDSGPRSNGRIFL